MDDNARWNDHESKNKMKKIDEKPNLIKFNDLKIKFDVPQNTGPEINRELAQRIKRIGSTGNEVDDKMVSNLKENTLVVRYTI